MSKGRRAKPVEVKKAQGNAGKRKLPETEGVVDYKDSLEPYDWLTETGKEAFNELCSILGFETNIKVLAESDRMALGMLADVYSEWRVAREIVNELGQTMKKVTTNGEEVEVVRPQMAIAQDAWKRMKSMLVEFGLTPASRGNVLTQQAEKENGLRKLIRARFSD